MSANGRCSSRSMRDGSASGRFSTRRTARAWPVAVARHGRCAGWLNRGAFPRHELRPAICGGQGHGQGRSHITPPDRTIFLQIGSGRRNRSRPVDGAWSRRTVGGCAAHAERARHGDYRRTMVADRSNPRPDSPRATDHPPAGPVLKVIFVDDDAIVRTSAAEILADLSHDVIQTVSGEEALFGAPPRALRSADHRSSDTRPTRLGRDRGGRTAAAGYACTTYHRVRGQPCWSRTWA